DAQLTLQRTAVCLTQLRGSGGEDEDRLPEHRQILHVRGVEVGLADGVRRGGRDAADREGGDVELLPGGQVLAYDDCDLGVDRDLGVGRGPRGAALAARVLTHGIDRVPRGAGRSWTLVRPGVVRLLQNRRVEKRARDWARYWRAPGSSIEVMRAHFETHRYHRHSHDTYSFGVTESGAQTFNCRGAKRTSAAGMVMAFNPDEPHDGHATDALGFTYSIVYIRDAEVIEILGDQRGRRTGSPLFAEPVMHDRAAADALRRLSAAVAGGQRLVVEEARDAAIRALVRRTPLRTSMAFALDAQPEVGRHDAGVLRVRDLLRAEYAREIGAD